MAHSIGAYSGLRRAGAPAGGSALRASASRPVSGRRAAVVAIAEPPSRPLEVESQRPKPRVPDNTPVVSPLELPLRPRRNRRSPTVRAAFREARAHARRARAHTCLLRRHAPRQRDFGARQLRRACMR